jgi:hypothetical protein
MERRRRVPRQSAGWSGRFKDEGDRFGDWGDCLVIDISVLGVGLELYGPVPRDLIGRRIAVEVQTPIGTSVSIRLAGEVRNTAPGPHGGVRVGMEFVGLTETERSILNALELMQIAW